MVGYLLEPNIEIWGRFRKNDFQNMSIKKKPEKLKFHISGKKKGHQLARIHQKKQQH